MKQKFLIAYDIFDDKTRRKIQKFLSGYSNSYQKSVFEVDVSKKELKEIVRFINELVEDDDLIGVFSYDDIFSFGVKEVDFII